MNEFSTIDELITCATKGFQKLVSNGFGSNVVVTQIKNSRYAPKNGVVNEKRTDPPFSYHGFKGVLTFVTYIDNPASILREYDIHVNVGGPIGENRDGTKVFNFMVEFFLDDFPIIKKKYDEIYVWKLLQKENAMVTIGEINSW